MANSIALAQKYQPILDDIYKLGSKTASMDGDTKPVDFDQANVVMIYKMGLIGMGTYSRVTGYPPADVTGTWETLALSQERGRSMAIDRMDNEESLGMAFGKLVGEFMRLHVIPEVDAYRFATYASKTGVLKVGTPAALSSSTVKAAIQTAKVEMDEAEVPEEGRILFISGHVRGALEDAVGRQLANETVASQKITVYNDMEVRMVPQTRFYTAITLNAGATPTTGGFAKNSTSGADINFMIVHPTAVLQKAKHAKIKIFSPDENQSKDSWMFQYRIYHDAFVYDQKVKGIYVHHKPVS